MENIHKLTFLYFLSDMNLYLLASKLSFNSKNVKKLKHMTDLLHESAFCLTSTIIDLSIPNT